MATLFDDKVIVVTGGTGSVGSALVRAILRRSLPTEVVIFSRDELKQSEMRRRLTRLKGAAGRLRFLIGNVRDARRLQHAFEGADLVVHAAALKHVPICERNPYEAVKTNILGSQHVVEAAVANGVERVLAISTDKACSPVSLYGATKLTAERLILAGNDGHPRSESRFSVIRYGNVLGTRGTVIPRFLELRESGRIPITHPEMSRFWVTVPQAVEHALWAIEAMQGGEVFVPKAPSMQIAELGRALAPYCEQEVVGIRPGERIHETLIGRDEALKTVELDDCFVIAAAPLREHWLDQGETMSEQFEYRSDTNPEWLSRDELRRLAGLPQRATAGTA